MSMMILYGCAYTVLVLCIGDRAPREKKVLASASALFALAFCITVGMAYFVQLTSTRSQLALGLTEGLQQFTQSYSLSFISAVNMLGWTVFYPLSSLFLVFLLEGSRPGRAAKWFSAAIAAAMFIGLTGYLTSNFWILLICMNFGLGAASFGFLISVMVKLKSDLS